MSKRITGFVLLLIGVAVGVGAAQVLPGAPSSFLNSGLFTVNSDEGVNFHVSLRRRARRFARDGDDASHR